jgi:hypothetical protein
LTTPEDCARNFPNDPTVADNVALLRRIPYWHFYFDERLGRMRPRSAAFEDDADGDPMSVYRRDIINAEGGTVARVMVGHEGFALASFTAGQVRFKDQTVFPDPLPEESSHAKICGPKPESTRRWFAKQSEWVIAPPVG